MKKDTQLKCQVCGEPVTGSPIYWRCSASKYHYWQWRTDRLRKARQEWERTRTPYQREVLSVFKSDETRAGFLARHAPTYALVDTGAAHPSPSLGGTRGRRSQYNRGQLIVWQAKSSASGQKATHRNSPSAMQPAPTHHNHYKSLTDALSDGGDQHHHFIQPIQVRSLSNKSALNNIAP